MLLLTPPLYFYAVCCVMLPHTHTLCDVPNGTKHYSKHVPLMKEGLCLFVEIWCLVMIAPGQIFLQSQLSGRAILDKLVIH